jgi:hypothetical protein
MTRKYFVIDGVGTPSWNEKDDLPESFAAYRPASLRAREIAERDPGADVHICVTVAVARHTGIATKVKKLPSR